MDGDTWEVVGASGDGWDFVGEDGNMWEFVEGNGLPSAPSVANISVDSPEDRVSAA